MTDQTEANTEPVEANTEPVEANTEPVEANTEPVEANTEPVEAKLEDRTRERGNGFLRRVRRFREKATGSIRQAAIQFRPDLKEKSNSAIDKLDKHYGGTKRDKRKKKDGEKDAPTPGAPIEDNLPLNVLLDRFKASLALNPLESKNAATEWAITRDELLTAIESYGALTREERDGIGLVPRKRTDALVEQARRNVLIYAGKNTLPVALRMYEASLAINEVVNLEEGTKQEATDKKDEENQDQKTDKKKQAQNETDPEAIELERIIRNTIDHTLGEYPPEERKARTDLADKITGKVSSYLAEIELQSFSGKQQQISAGYVQRMAQLVTENYLLQLKLPVFVDDVSISNVSAEPRPVRDGENVPIFDKWLLDQEKLKEGEPATSLLIRRPVHKVTVYFFIKIKRKYLEKHENDLFLRRKIRADGDDENIVRLYFEVSSLGIGGSISGIIRALNWGLLWDVGCLRSYFPIAQDLYLNPDLPDRNVESLVYSHNLVMLCRQDILAEAIKASKPANSKTGEPEDLKDYHTYAQSSFIMRTKAENNKKDNKKDKPQEPDDGFKKAFNEPIGRGDCTTFNSIICLSRAALHARLRAIYLADIQGKYKERAPLDPEIYIEDLSDRIRHTYLLNAAQALFKKAPYSSLACESLLHNQWPEVAAKWELKSTNSYSLHSACLLLAETFLHEGAYRKAYRYLSRLEYIKKIGQQGSQWYASESETGEDFDLFSSAVISRYYLCIAHYTYLLDLGIRSAEELKYWQLSFPEREDKTTPNESTRTQKVLLYLKEAEIALKIRLAKYQIVGEGAQAAFEPHYGLLARIYFLRARAYLFTAVNLENSPPPGSQDFIPTHTDKSAKSIYLSRLFLLEKARTFASMSGDRALYACYTAISSCVYLMASLYRNEISLPEEISVSFVQNHGYAIQRNGESITEPNERHSRCLKRAKNLRDHALLCYSETGYSCYDSFKNEAGKPDKSKELNETAPGNATWQQGDTIPKIIVDPILAIQETYDGKPKIENGILTLDLSLLAIRKEWLSVSDGNDPDSSVYMFGMHSAFLLYARGLHHLCSDEFTLPDSSGNNNEFSHKISVDHEDFSAVEHWLHKLDIAYKLFLYAWGIADDGGLVCEATHKPPKKGNNSPETKEETVLWMKRFKGKDKASIPREVATIRDVYPARMGEVADLSKLFAAACLHLKARINIDDIEEDDTKENGTIEIEDFYAVRDTLLSQLQSDRHTEQDIIRRLQHNQSRVNGHLNCLWDECKSILSDTPKPSLKIHAAILKERDTLLRKLFDTMMPDN